MINNHQPTLAVASLDQRPTQHGQWTATSTHLDPAPTSTALGGPGGTQAEAL